MVQQTAHSRPLPPSRRALVISERLTGIYFLIGLAVGTILFGAQSLHAESLVYIPLGSENSAIVINADRDVVVSRIGSLPSPHGLAVTPDGKLLVVGSYAVRDLGAAAPQKPASVSEDEHAAHHAPAAKPATKKAAAISTVSIVRAADGAIVRRIDVLGAAHHVAVSPDGRFAVVTHPDEDGISAIDLRSYRVVASVKTGPVPNYAAFGRDGTTVYVSNAGSGTVSVVGAGLWAVKGSIAVGDGPEHIVLSPDGGVLYVNNVNDGTVSVISLGQGKVVKTIPVGSALHGIDVSEDGKTLFVTAMGDEKIVSVDVATGDQGTMALRPLPYHLAVVRGSGKLYVSSADEPKVWVVDQRNLSVLGEIAIGGKGHQMAQSPQ